MASINRLFLAVGGLCGAAGVGLSALGSHSGGGNSAIAGSFLIMHAAALLGIAALPSRRLLGIAGIVLAVGLILFAGDLVARERLGGALFPMAAPIGGGGLILGWLLVAASALFSER